LLSEKDGWNHIYTIDVMARTMITKGDYDVMAFDQVDEADGVIYFTARLITLRKNTCTVLK